MPLQRKSAQTSESGVPVPILTASDVSPYLKCAIYGPSGSGKTTLAASAVEVADLSPVLFIDCGNSSDTLLGEPRFADVQIMRVVNLDDLQKIFVWLAPKEWGIGGQGAVENYRTVIIDEFDELHMFTMRMIMDELVKQKPERNRYLPSQQEWGIARSRMLEMIDWFRSLPCNFFVVCVPNIKENELTNREEVTLGLPGKLANDLAKRLSLVLYLEMQTKRSGVGANAVTTTTRVAKFAPSPRHHTKVRGESRAARLGEEMDSPSMTEIFRKWF